MKLILLILVQSLLAVATSPSGGYAPGQVDCPDKDLLRNATGLSPEEADWVSQRNPITKAKIADFLSGSNLDDFDVDEFMSQVDDTIKIGIAFSGGGYRAMLSGAGQMLALDDRYDNSTQHGLGGLLQSATYLTGLSGGSWLVGSVVLNNYTSIDDIVNQRQIWDLQNNILDYGGWNIIETANYFTEIDADMIKKQIAGFPLSITDIWGRTLSYQFFSTLPDGGVSLLWSDIRDIDLFSSHQMPFPIISANGRTPGSVNIDLTTTNVELGPFEIGSWDPSVYQFVDTKYIGTDLKDGQPVNGVCIAGLDNAGFSVGTSSSLFNGLVMDLGNEDLPSLIAPLYADLMALVDGIDLKSDWDIAIWKSNPFFNTSEGTYAAIENHDELDLCDGGLDDQNVPLQPLIQKERDVDVIFAYDNSADTNLNWPDGASLSTTYQRQFTPQGNHTGFPYVPDITSFRNLNLTARPAFFGCDASNLTSLDTDDNYVPPLIVYTANRPFSFYSNVSTYQLSFSDQEKRSMITNGFEVASRLNSTLDDEWRACVSCAIIKRTQERLNMDQSEQCQRCFQEYCWNGDIDASTVPGDNFTPEGISVADGMNI